MHRMIQSRVFCNVHISHNCHTNSMIKRLPSVRKVPRLAERVESSNASPASFHNRSRLFRFQTPNLILKTSWKLSMLFLSYHPQQTQFNISPTSFESTYSVLAITPSFPLEGDMWIANGPSSRRSHQRVLSLFFHLSLLFMFM
jgi:hypothetical protein